LPKLNVKRVNWSLTILINLENNMNTVTANELTIALQEAKADIAAGRCNHESVAEHMRRVTDA